MVTAGVIGSVSVGTLGVALSAQPAGAATTTLTIAPTGTDTGNCQSAECATLGYALSQAAPGDTVVLEPGIYNPAADPASTSNTVPAGLSGLTIESDASKGGDAANTIISDASAYGLTVNANDVTVSGITFENSGGAGILLSPPASATAPATVTGETIEHDVMSNSDQCTLTPSTAVCTAAIGAGDYGESLWLESVTDSTVEGTTVQNGLDGGILVSDEVGPNDGNTIEDNQVIDNVEGCGITLAGHNEAALYTTGPNAGKPDPTAGGVFDNTVKDNTSDGAGANGVGLFNFAYDNTIEGNTLNGNGGPGVEIDDDIPFADLNGNSITGNTVGVNSLEGGPGGSAGQHTVHTTQTAGVLVIARGTPVTGTVIENNTITGNYYGVWMSELGSSTTLSGNAITVAKGGVPVFTSPTAGAGYWLVAANGGVFSYGQAPFEGSAGNVALSQPVVAEAPTPDGGGYWLVAKDGGIFTYGDANYYGSLPGQDIHVSDIVGIAPTLDGGGYWLVGSDGGIFSFGDARSRYFGSLPGQDVHVSDIVGIAPTADDGGYWLVAKDGGVFAFGDAGFFGSLPGQDVHVSDIVGIAATADGGGYWLVGSDGGIFAFGDAVYSGSLPGQSIHVSDVVGIADSPDGGGYWLVAKDGGVFTFGDAGFSGSLPGQSIHVSDVVGLVPTPGTLVG